MHVHYYFDNPAKARLSGKESAIILEVYMPFGRVRVRTGVRIEARYWDPKRQCAKKSYPGVIVTNHYLSNLKTRALSILREEAIKHDLSREDIRRHIERLIVGSVQNENDFHQRFREYIESKRVTLSRNSTKKHVTALNHLIDYEKRFNKRITFGSIDYSFFEHFVGYLITEKGHLDNTVLKQIVIIKGFLNWAMDMGFTANDNHRKFKMKERETEIIHLTEGELFAVFELDLSMDRRLARARDLFCFQAFTGQRYSDVRNLDWDAIDFENRWWILTSQKTKDKLRIPLNDFAITILERYRVQQRFPVMSNQKLNKALKVLGEKAGINSPFSIVQFSGSNRIETKGPKYEFLTSHVARKTFVTLSLAKGMRQETVASITGHRDYKTLRKYVKITNDMRASEMQRIWSSSSDKSLF